ETPVGKTFEECKERVRVLQPRRMESHGRAVAQHDVGDGLRRRSHVKRGCHSDPGSTKTSSATSGRGRRSFADCPQMRSLPLTRTAVWGEELARGTRRNQLFACPHDRKSDLRAVGRHIAVWLGAFVPGSVDLDPAITEAWGEPLPP